MIAIKSDIHVSNTQRTVSIYNSVVYLAALYYLQLRYVSGFLLVYNGYAGKGFSNVVYSVNDTTIVFKVYAVDHYHHRGHRLRDPLLHHVSMLNTFHSKTYVIQFKVFLCVLKGTAKGEFLSAGYSIVDLIRPPD